MKEYASKHCLVIISLPGRLNICLALLVLWTVPDQAPLPKEFPRQEYWSGLPFPSPEGLPNPRIKPESPSLAGEFFKNLWL